MIKKSSFFCICNSVESEIQDIKQLESELESNEKYRQKAKPTKCKSMRKLKDFRNRKSNVIIYAQRHSQNW